MNAPAATDLLLMRLRDDLREGRDLGGHIPMLLARIEADRGEIRALKDLNTALADDCEAMIAQLREELAEADALRERMAGLLTGVANALKGEPGELRLHDWSDLPALAGRVPVLLDQIEETSDALTRMLRDDGGLNRTALSGIRDRLDALAGWPAWRHGDPPRPPVARCSSS